MRPQMFKKCRIELISLLLHRLKWKLHSRSLRALCSLGVRSHSCSSCVGMMENVPTLIVLPVSHMLVAFTIEFDIIYGIIILCILQ